MSQKYWDMFYDFKVATYYYQFYSVRSRRLKAIISVLCTLSSSAFVVSWYQTGKLHLLWATLILISQIISVIQPCFPYEKQYHAACYIHQDVDQLVTKVENTWSLFTQDTDSKEIHSYMQGYQEEYAKIETRFAQADLFPYNMRILKKAEETATTYFRRFYQ